MLHLRHYPVPQSRPKVRRYASCHRHTKPNHQNSSQPQLYRKTLTPPNFRLVAIGACANKLLIPSTTSLRQCRGLCHQGDASLGARAARQWAHGHGRKTLAWGINHEDWEACPIQSGNTEQGDRRLGHLDCSKAS